METILDKAGVDDYDEIIDFLNYVFSNAHAPHDFPRLMPKLFKREYFANGIHYLVREAKKIRALVGSYPLVMEVYCKKRSGITAWKWYRRSFGTSILSIPRLYENTNARSH